MPIWACPSSVPNPGSITDELDEDDPGVYSVKVVDSFDSRCLGNPLPGWEFIEQIQGKVWGCNHGCPN